MLMPGAGFIVVASDCLAAHVLRRFPQARRLRLGISASPLVSRGSARTMNGMIGEGVYVRRDGRLVRLPGSLLERRFDFGRGPRTCVAVSWPDVYTAFHTTGIPDVEAFLEVEPWQRALVLGSRYFAWLLRAPPWRLALEAQVRALPEGPSAAERARHPRALVVEAADGNGRRTASRLRTPEAYSFTAAAAVEIAVRVLQGDLESGFQTPARIYGPDFVLGLPGVVREDL
jgi:short subunit dehydrogenase-like uncharacterized protein